MYDCGGSEGQLQRDGGLLGECRIVVGAIVAALTCDEQYGNADISDAVKREVTQGLQEGHRVDKGVAIGASCLFFDFETCEKIEIRRSNVRFPSLHDVA